MISLLLKLSYIVISIKIAHTPNTAKENPNDVDVAKLDPNIKLLMSVEFVNILLVKFKLLNGINFIQSFVINWFKICIASPFPIYNATLKLTETAVFLVIVDNITANSAKSTTGIAFTK